MFAKDAGGLELLLAAPVMISRIIVLALVVAGIGVPAAAQARFNRIGFVGVADGDTISMTRDGRSARVRLEGIDCPEKC